MLVPQKILAHRPIPQELTGALPGAYRDGAEVDAAPLEEAGEAEVLVEPVLMSADTPEVGQTGGGAAEASLADAARAWTLEPELPASSAIKGSTPEEVLVAEEVSSVLSCRR